MPDVLPMDLYLALAGMAAGLLAGLLGVGGGFVVVPALALAGWPMATAVGTSLLFVTAMGLAGTLSHARRGNVEWRVVWAAALPAAVGAQLGALGAASLPGWVLRAAFAAALLAAAHDLARPAPAVPDGPARPAAGAALGGVVGVASGLLGVGGGVLLVPGLRRWVGLSLERAIAGSMAIVVLTGVAGVVGHVALGHLAARPAAWLLAGGLVGMPLGLWGLRRVPPEPLRRGFAAFLVALAAWMAWTAAARLLAGG